MKLSLWLILIGCFILSNFSIESACYRGPAGGTRSPTFAYISILMGVFSNMLLTLKEQKVSLESSFSCFLSSCFLAFISHLLCFCYLKTTSLPVFFKVLFSSAQDYSFTLLTYLIMTKPWKIRSSPLYLHWIYIDWVVSK